MRDKPASGTILVMALVGAALVAALGALKYRVYEPRHPTTQAATAPV